MTCKDHQRYQQEQKFYLPGHEERFMGRLLTLMNQRRCIGKQY